MEDLNVLALEFEGIACACCKGSYYVARRTDSRAGVTLVSTVSQLQEECDYNFIISNFSPFQTASSEQESSKKNAMLPHLAQIWLRVLVDGDCDWFCLHFSTKLILLGMRSNVPTSALIKGFHNAWRIVKEILLSCDGHSYDLLDEQQQQQLQQQQQQIQQQLQQNQRRYVGNFSWSNIESDISVIKTSLRSHSTMCSLLSNDKLDIFAHCLLRSFLSSLNDDNNKISGTGGLTPYLLYQHFYGCSIEKIQDYPDTIMLEDIPIPPYQYAISEGAVIAIFDCSLEANFSALFGAGGGGSIIVEPPAQNVTPMPCSSPSLNEHDCNIERTNLEYSIYDTWARLIQESHITLVICQQRIHPYLQRTLAQMNISCLPRLSLRYINAMQALTGAKILGGMPTLFHPSLPLPPPSIKNVSITAVPATVATVETAEALIKPDNLGYLWSLQRQCLHKKDILVVCGKRQRQRQRQCGQYGGETHRMRDEVEGDVEGKGEAHIDVDVDEDEDEEGERDRIRAVWIKNDKMNKKSPLNTKHNNITNSNNNDSNSNSNSHSESNDNGGNALLCDNGLTDVLLLSTTPSNTTEIPHKYNRNIIQTTDACESFVNAVLTRRKRVTTIAISSPITSVGSEVQRASEYAVRQLTTLLIDTKIITSRRDMWKHGIIESLQARLDNLQHLQHLQHNASWMSSNYSVIQPVKIYIDALKSTLSTLHATADGGEVCSGDSGGSDDDDDDDNNNEFAFPVRSLIRQLDAVTEAVTCLLDIDGTLYQD